MMRIVVFVCLVGVFLGCQVPSFPKASESAPAALDLTKPGAVIKNLTFGAVVLPKSLQDGSTNPEAQVAKSLARSVGDVSTLTSLSLPSLKASGYQSFKQSIDQQSIAKVFLDALKAVPAIADGSLGPDTTIDTGTISMNIGYGSDVTLPNSGRLRTALSGDGQTLWIYWSLSYPNPTSGYSYSSPQDIFTNAPRCLIDLYFVVQKSGAAQMYAYRPDDGQNHFMNFWTKFDANSGASVEAQESNWSGTAGQTGTSLSAVLPEAGGGFSIFRTSTSPGYAYQSLGYADDHFGGVVTTGSNTYDDDGSGPNAPTDHPYLNVEYYDGTGDLVFQGWGQSARDPAQWDWRFDQASSTNLPNKVDSFQTKTVWNGVTQTSSISYDGGATWTPYTPVGYQFVYHDVSNDGGPTWRLQPGDATYGSSGYHSDWDSVNNTSTWTVSYYKSYEVPQGETYFGQTYFVNKTYPLKNLLPLKAQYALGYEVKQREGVTYYRWQKPDLNWDYGTTAPAPGGYVAGTLYHWTNFDFWLENKNFLNASGVNDNDATERDSDKGDVNLLLQNMTVYSWNQTLMSSVRSEAPAYSTYQSDLPPYFSLSQAKLDAVAATKSRLETVYAHRDDHSVASYLAGFTATITAVLPLFPSLSGYPGAP